jgi:flagellar biosynthesis/type III secretory pathway protein FliH
MNIVTQPDEIERQLKQSNAIFRQGYRCGYEDGFLDGKLEGIRKARELVDAAFKDGPKPQAPGNL